MITLKTALTPLERTLDALKHTKTLEIEYLLNSPTPTWIIPPNAHSKKYEIVKMVMKNWCFEIHKGTASDLNNEIKFESETFVYDSHYNALHRIQTKLLRKPGSRYIFDTHDTPFIFLYEKEVESGNTLLMFYNPVDQIPLGIFESQFERLNAKIVTKGRKIK